MGQPIRRAQHATVRAYVEQLQALWEDLSLDRLDEAKSLAFIAHIVNNRPAAAQAYAAIEASAGVPC